MTENTSIGIMTENTSIGIMTENTSIGIMTDENNKNQTLKSRTKDEAIIVVAIDFGTTYSGWAFSLRDKYQEDNLDIQMNNGWKTGDSLITPKTPTAVLFDPEENFHSFGYNAENQYTNLLEEEKEEGWKFFRNFKMAIHCDEQDNVFPNKDLVDGFCVKLSPNLQIKDVKGNKMAAMKVFSESLKFLKQSFLNTLHDRVPGIPPEYIHWVLTVPSIWTDKAKQFMRTAAIQADIPGHLLTLAYEPEAAALYCKNTPIAKKTNDDVKLSSFQDGDCFLVLDCGGGTADVTSYKVLPNGLFQELHYPTGGPWGGAQVDKNFLHFMEKIFGKEIWTSFQTESYEDALFLQRNFELKKRTVGEDLSHNEIILHLPLWLLVKSAEVTFPDGVRCTKNKLKISLELMTKLFDSTLSDIVKHLSDLLKMPIMNNIDTILMVGGFSECRLLRQTMHNQFSKMRIICPEDAVLSVLKGGVIFGNSPSLINERVCPRTYGVETNVPFDTTRHSDLFHEVIDGRHMCTCVFKPLVKKGDIIVIGKSEFKANFHPTRKDDKVANVNIYSSTEIDPMYTYGAYVKKVGELSLNIPDVENGKKRIICVKMIFDSTEINVSAIDVETDCNVKGTFDCLI